MDYLKTALARLELPKKANEIVEAIFHPSFIESNEIVEFLLPEELGKEQRKGIHRLCEELLPGILTHETDADGVLHIKRYPRIPRLPGTDLRPKFIRGFLILEQQISKQIGGFLEARRKEYERASFGLALDLNQDGDPMNEWKPLLIPKDGIGYYGIGKDQERIQMLYSINAMRYAFEEIPPKGTFVHPAPALLVALLEAIDARKPKVEKVKVQIRFSEIYYRAEKYSETPIDIHSEDLRLFRLLELLNFVEKLPDDNSYSLTTKGLALAIALVENFEIEFPSFEEEDPFAEIPLNEDFDFEDLDSIDPEQPKEIQEEKTTQIEDHEQPEEIQEEKLLKPKDEVEPEKKENGKESEKANENPRKESEIETQSQAIQKPSFHSNQETQEQNSAHSGYTTPKKNLGINKRYNETKFYLTPPKRFRGDSEIDPDAKYGVRNIRGELDSQPSQATYTPPRTPKSQSQLSQISFSQTQYQGGTQRYNEGGEDDDDETLPQENGQEKNPNNVNQEEMTQGQAPPRISRGSSAIDSDLADFLDDDFLDDI